MCQLHMHVSFSSNILFQSKAISQIGDKEAHSIYASNPNSYRFVIKTRR
jgi:hypothetical protein